MEASPVGAKGASGDLEEVGARLLWDPSSARKFREVKDCICLVLSFLNRVGFVCLFNIYLFDFPGS